MFLCGDVHAGVSLEFLCWCVKWDMESGAEPCVDVSDVLVEMLFASYLP